MSPPEPPEGGQSCWGLQSHFARPLLEAIKGSQSALSTHSAFTSSSERVALASETASHPCQADAGAGMTHRLVHSPCLSVRKLKPFPPLPTF